MLVCRVCLLFPVDCVAQEPSTDKLTAKAFETAVSYAQSLTQWGFIIIGGSLLILVGTSYYRPVRKCIRYCYFLFIPGWACLGASIYYGMRVQQAYLAYLLVKNTTLMGTVETTNRDAGNQIFWLRIGLLAFALWLLAYLCWWVLADKIQDKATN